MEFTTNEYNTPLLRHLFKQVENDLGGKNSEFVGYVNGDILFSFDLLMTLHMLSQEKRKLETGAPTLLQFTKMMAVGKRVNSPFSEEDVLPSSIIDATHLMVEKATQLGEMYIPNAIDYFIMTPGTIDWYGVLFIYCETMT